MGAVTAPGGLYRSSGAAGRHFRTAAASPTFTAAVLTLAERLDAALGYPDQFHFVDMAAGDGRLLAGVRESLPARHRPRWRWSAVELAGPPAGLPPDVSWRRTPPEGVTGMIVANEWLDTIPVDVVVDVGGPRRLSVDSRGREQVAGRPTRAELDWLARFWPLDGPGSRSEVGHRRDAGWHRLVRTLRAGAVLAVDYPAGPAHSPGGSLTGFRAGRQVLPRPGGDTDLTAGVVFAALISAGQTAGAQVCLLSQRRAVDLLAAARERSKTSRPMHLLGEMAAAGDRAELRLPSGLGGFRWLLATSPGVAARPLLGIA